MPMLMMSIWKMWMGMYQQFVPVKMAMFAVGCHRIIVFMLVVLVMNVFMIVLNLRVGMTVLMVLGQMQPCAQRHQGSGNE